MASNLFIALGALALLLPGPVGAQDMSASIGETYRSNVGVIGRAHQGKLRTMREHRLRGRTAQRATPTTASCRQRAAARGYRQGPRYVSYMRACLGH